MEIKRKAKAAKDPNAPVLGSGDFLADQGYVAPDEARFKIQLANKIALLIENQGLKQAEAAKLAGLKQSDVSRIVNGNLAGYSTYRLMSVLKSLGTKVTVSVEELSSTGSETSHSFALAL